MGIMMLLLGLGTIFEVKRNRMIDSLSYGSCLTY